MAGVKNRVRIIAGTWRSRIIAFPQREHLRPTPDRVRETLFNWIGQDLTGKACLDLFAGSGALGFEAASRGARRVVLVESDREVFEALQVNRDKLGGSTVEVIREDALKFIRADRGKYDVIFLDPPFNQDYFPQLLSLLPRHLAPQGWVYAEGPKPPQLGPGWQAWRTGRAGKVSYQLLRWVGVTTA